MSSQLRDLTLWGKMLKATLLILIGFGGFTGNASAQNDVDEALKSFGEIVTGIDKKTPYKRRKEKYEYALEIFERMVKKHEEKTRVFSDQELATIYTSRGVCYQELYEYEKALLDYSKALRYNQEKGSAWVGIAEIRASAPIDDLRKPELAIEAGGKAMFLFDRAFNDIKLKLSRNKFEKLSTEIALLNYMERSVIAAACAHAENEDFKKAVSYLDKAKSKEAREYLELFRSSKKYRLPNKDEEEMKLAKEENYKKEMTESAQKKLDEKEADYKVKMEMLKKLEAEYREAGKKSTNATDEDEKNKWKEISKSKYNEWKQLKGELEALRVEINTGKDALKKK